MKNLWYRLTLKSCIDNPYTLLEEIEFKIGGNTIEKFTGVSLEILAQFDHKAMYSQSGNTIVFPLSICTTALPIICLAYHELTISIKLSKEAQLESHVLEIAYVYLDTNERRELIQNVNALPYVYPITQKFYVKKCHVICSEGKPIKIPITSNYLSNRIRDIAFKITPIGGTGSTDMKLDHDGIAANDKEAFLLMLLERIDKLESQLRQKMSSKDPMKTATFMFSSELKSETFVFPSQIQIRHKQDAIMLKKAIPREYYGFENNENIYYMPFDHTPSQPYASSSICIKNMIVELELDLHPGTYDIELLIRHENALEITSGMGKLKYQPLDLGH